MHIDTDKQAAFVNRVIADLSASYAGVMVNMGHKLGLYKALAGAGPVTSHEMAARTGCAERYVREWLNSQSAGGYLIYHPASQSYELPGEHVAVLADDESPLFMPLAWEVPASMWFDQDKAIEAFRTGAGVAWGDHDERLYCGSAAFYRNGYRASLVQDWLPALDGVVDKLEAGVRVADVGCGHGHTTVLMAEAFPNSEFWGFDAHDASIATAKTNAEAAGVAGRARFDIADAKGYGVDGGLDLICFFDCLHDMGDPVGAAAHAAESLNDGGTVMLVEPFANDRVEDNTGPISQAYYAASSTLCCAHSLSEEVGLALGAQAGEARLAAVFAKAGFTRFRRVMETPFNLILEARR